MELGVCESESLKDCYEDLSSETDSRTSEPLDLCAGAHEFALERADAEFRLVCSLRGLLGVRAEQPELLLEARLLRLALLHH